MPDFDDLNDKIRAAAKQLIGALRDFAPATIWPLTIELQHALEAYDTFEPEYDDDVDVCPQGEDC